MKQKLNEATGKKGLRPVSDAELDQVTGGRHIVLFVGAPCPTLKDKDSCSQNGCKWDEENLKCVNKS